jgi:hypothetical protein
LEFFGGFLDFEIKDFRREGVMKTEDFFDFFWGVAEFFLCVIIFIAESTEVLFLDDDLISSIIFLNFSLEQLFPVVRFRILLEGTSCLLSRRSHVIQ